MRWLADFIYLVAGLLYLPVALYNAVVLGKNRRGWSARFGAVPRRDPIQKRIWIHAVSLGEINATPRLIDALRARLPDHEIVVSTTTDTGYARAVQLYGEKSVFRFPLDFSWVISRALRRINPTLIVLVELEVWFNLVRMASDRGVPVVVVNGRLTERSTRRFSTFGVFCRLMFKRLAWVGAQDERIASRFRQLGVAEDRVEVTSSLKWDSAVVTDRVDGADALAKALGVDAGRPVWVCGSTGPGEESIVLEAYRLLLAGKANALGDGGADSSNTDEAPPPLLVVVPRKPERFDEVARLIGRFGFPCVRRSQRPDGAAGDRLEGACVVLGDTMGELRKFYSLADVVLVGRSMVPMGGSDPMEVAALARPMIVGPHMENFAAPIEVLGMVGAIRTVDSGESLGAAVSEMLRDPDHCQEIGAKARSVVLQHQGATERTADAIATFLLN